MAILPFLGSILTSVLGKSVVSTVVDTAKDWFNKRSEIKHLREMQGIEMRTAEHKARLAKVERDQRLYADADIASIEQWEHSFIDELFKGTVLMLFWLPFVPQVSPYMLEGAVILAKYPLWIQIIMAGTFVSVLGLRYLFLAPLERIFPNIGKKNS